MKLPPDRSGSRPPLATHGARPVLADARRAAQNALTPGVRPPARRRRCFGSTTCSLTAAEVGVLSFYPVLARRAEHVEVVGVLKRERFVRHVRRDNEHLASLHLVDFR